MCSLDIGYSWSQTSTIISVGNMPKIIKGTFVAFFCDDLCFGCASLPVETVVIIPS